MTLYSIPPLVSALLYLFLGIIVLAKKKERVHKILFWFAFFSFWWQFSWFFLFNTENHDIANLIVKIGYSGIVFLPLVLNSLFISFTDKCLNKKYIFSHLTIALIFVISVWSNDFFVNGYFQYWFGFYPKANWLHMVYLVWLSYLLTHGLIILYVYYKKLNRYQESKKNQLKFVWLGSFIYVLATIDFLTNYGVPWYPIGFIFILIGLFCYSYSIIKYNLINISLAGRYALIFMAYAMTILCLLTPIVYLKTTAFLHLVYVFVCCLFVPFIFNFIKGKSNFFLGKKFEYINKLHTLEDLEENSLKNILDWLEKTMRLNGIDLYLEDQNEFYSYADDRKLKNHNEILDLIDDREHLFLNETKLINDNFNYELVFPLFHNNLITGLLFLGHKQDSFFDEIDLKKLHNIVKIIEKYLIFEIAQNHKHTELLETNKKHILEATRKIIEIKDVQELSKTIINIILRLTDAERAGIYLLEDDKYKLKHSRNIDLKEIDEDDGIIEVLKQSNKYMSFEKIKNLSLESDFTFLKKAVLTMQVLNANFIFPILIDRLVGFIVIGKDKFFNTKEIHDVDLITFSTAMAIENIFLNKETVKDGLANCYNRGYFDKNINQIILNSITQKESLFMFMIDINDFKEINDTRGHQAGDQVIKELVEILNQNKRVSDMIFRYGGDEFVMIIRDISYDEVKQIERRIKESMQQSALEFTFSIGISALEVTDKHYKLAEVENLKKELIRKADDDLYKAKKNSKNRVNCRKFGSFVFKLKFSGLVIHNADEFLT